MTDNDSLTFTDACLNPEYHICFCIKCMEKRGDTVAYTRGDPPKLYALPVGWGKFGLKYVSK